MSQMPMSLMLPLQSSQMWQMIVAEAAKRPRMCRRRCDVAAPQSLEWLQKCTKSQKKFAAALNLRC
jgi:hypothetical protein